MKGVDIKGSDYQISFIQPTYKDKAEHELKNTMARLTCGRSDDGTPFGTQEVQLIHYDDVTHFFTTGALAKQCCFVRHNIMKKFRMSFHNFSASLLEMNINLKLILAFSKHQCLQQDKSVDIVEFGCHFNEKGACK